MIHPVGRFVRRSGPGGWWSHGRGRPNRAGPWSRGQNLMPPIIPATFVVNSLMVGAIDELAM